MAAKGICEHSKILYTLYTCFDGYCTVHIVKNIKSKFAEKINHQEYITVKF